MNRFGWRPRMIARGTLALTFTAFAAAGALALGAAFEPVSFSTLSNFEYELPDPLDPSAKPNLNQVPAPIKALNGKQVSIRGFMLPLDLDNTGVGEFMLNGSLDMCYFGAPVRMNEWVLVRMAGTKKARFTHLPIVVSGTLEVGEQMKNGRVMSLYRMSAVSAETDTK
jgi:uncharacterized protein